MSERLAYRPEIDGLRAVAVVAVVLFHAGFGFPGGYVGVDVFFVISGFLITSLIWKDLESGKFSFARFWEKRARRIMPAIVVMMLATLLAGMFILLPFDLRDLGQSSVAQSLFAGNVYFWIRGGYFEGPAAEKALLHTWSLAVEEQFYMLAPFLLWAVFRIKKLCTPNRVLMLLAAGFCVSLAISIHGVTYHPSAAYYLLPWRAWELMIGAMLAFCPALPGWLNHSGRREVMSVAGMAMILFSVFAYSEHTPFPGLAALLPCVGTALVIWSNRRSVTPAADSASAAVPTIVGRLLAAKPVVFIGLISYSLYLYHWPVLALARYEAMVELSWFYRLLLVIAGLILAVLSWRFVELPFRDRKLGSTRGRMFAFAAVGGVMVFGTGVMLRVTHGLPARLTPQQQQYASAYLDRSFGHELTVADIEAGNLVKIGDSQVDPSPEPRILVWGDSHAMSAVAAFDALLKENHMAGLVATRSATVPVYDWAPDPQKETDKQAMRFNSAVMSWLEQHPVPDVVLVASWSGYAASAAQDRTLSEALINTVRRIRATGAQPWVMLDVPSLPFDVPRKLILKGDSQTQPGLRNATPAETDSYDRLGLDTLQAIETAGGKIINPKAAFLNHDGSEYILQKDGHSLYSDSNHLSDTGAKLILWPWLKNTTLLH